MSSDRRGGNQWVDDPFRIAVLSGLFLAVSMVMAPVALAAPKCFGMRATIVGTPGSDRIMGTSGPDVINGQGGADVIIGRGGNDRICGGSGNDKITAGHGRDRVFGGGGRDRVEGDRGKDVLKGGGARDLIRGGMGSDKLTSNAGNDRIQGGGGNRDIAIFAGMGPVSADLRADVAETPSGTEEISGVEGIVGSRNGDVLLGDGTNNVFRGRLGPDMIKGRDGADILLGDSENDELSAARATIA